MVALKKILFYFVFLLIALLVLGDYFAPLYSASRKNSDFDLDYVPANELGRRRYYLDYMKKHAPGGLQRVEQRLNGENDFGKSPPTGKSRDVKALRDCSSPLNLARRSYTIELKKKILDQYQYCEKDSDCFYNDVDHYFIARLDKSRSIMECLDRVNWALSTNCSMEMGINYNSEKPLVKPNSIRCEKRVCSAVYSGPSSDWYSIGLKYRKENPITGKASMDKLCQSILSDPYGSRLDIRW
ncbi:MAG: hypothetical protein EOP07_19415 [Proteobacteria bacterium]|nr:MAG: hypothetical protein EOP07_19415 [Pseudomonadota bacterium]